MDTQPIAGTVIGTGSETEGAFGVYAEGLLAGLVGAATIALTFLILDVINGHPFYTPNMLGTALLQGGEGVAAPENLPISLELIVSFTWIHLLAFLLIGTAASQLLGFAEREPSAGFGILLLFVVFGFVFVLASMVLEEPADNALGWPAVLIANLLAAAAMAEVLWRRHPHLTIEP